MGRIFFFSIIRVQDSGEKWRFHLTISEKNAVLLGSGFRDFDVFAAKNCCCDLSF